jgi:hypothetical protein
MPLPPEYRRIGKRSKQSLNGTVPGVVYNRLHRGHRHATAPIGRLGYVQHGQMASRPHEYEPHPDEYNPHPGFAEFPAPQYDAREDAFLLPEMTPLTRFEPSEAALLGADGVPIDHVVGFDDSSSPAVDVRPNDGIPIDELWDRVLSRPTYSSQLLTEEMFQRAMKEADRMDDVVDPCSGECVGRGQGVFGADELPSLVDERDQFDCAHEAREILDQQIEQMQGAFIEPSLMRDATADSLTLDSIVEAHEIPDAQRNGALEAMQVEFPQPDHMPMEQMYEEQMMDPWMMPGMGPM